MSDFIESGRNFASDVSVDGDHDSRQYVIGFEDANGNFVEVGRFDNTANDVTQPLEIKHQNSGERVTLDSSGLKTQKIDDDRLYAGAFTGANADARLNSALSAASDGDVVYLESAIYDKDKTVDNRVSLAGTGIFFRGTRITGTTTWTFNESAKLRDIHLPDDTVTVNFNGNGSVVTNLNSVSGVTVSVDATRFRATRLSGLDVVLEANSAGCVVDASTNITVTDNGSANIIGDIA
jgi:hypothetical protein